MAISVAIASYNAVTSGGNATIPSGTQRMAVVSYRYADVSSPTAITIGGLSCTKQISKTYGSTLISEIWTLLIPSYWTSGSQTLTITGGSGTSVSVHMLTGVNQSKTPLTFSGATADATATSISLGVTGLSSGVIITNLYTGVGDSSNVFIADAFQTPNLAGARAGVGYNVGSTGSLTAIWDWSSTRAATLTAISIYPALVQSGSPVYYQ